MSLRNVYIASARLTYPVLFSMSAPGDSTLSVSNWGARPRWEIPGRRTRGTDCIINLEDAHDRCTKSSIHPSVVAVLPETHSQPPNANVLVSGALLKIVRSS